MARSMSRSINSWSAIGSQIKLGGRGVARESSAISRGAPPRVGFASRQRPPIFPHAPSLVRKPDVSFVRSGRLPGGCPMVGSRSSDLTWRSSRPTIPRHWREADEYEVGIPLVRLIYLGGDGDVYRSTAVHRVVKRSISRRGHHPRLSLLRSGSSCRGASLPDGLPPSRWGERARQPTADGLLWFADRSTSVVAVAMILCITLNPCLDKTLTVPPWRPGDLVRGVAIREVVGGKGNNVARALQRLGGPGARDIPRRPDRHRLRGPCSAGRWP